MPSKHESFKTPEKEKSVLQSALDAVNNLDIEKALDMTEHLKDEEITVLIDEIFKPSSDRSGGSYYIREIGLDFVEFFQKNPEKIDTSHRQYVAEKLIDSEPRWVSYCIYFADIFRYDTEVLRQYTLENGNPETLLHCYSDEGVSYQWRPQIRDTLIEQHGFFVHEEEIQSESSESPYTVLVKKLSGNKGSPSRTLDVSFVDKNGLTVSMAALLPGDGWLFYETSVLSDSCNKKIRHIVYRDITKPTALFTFLHEIGHAHDRLDDPRILGNWDGVMTADVLEEFVYSERYAWAWALNQIRKLKKGGFDIQQSYKDIIRHAYGALSSYDKGEETRKFTKGKFDGDEDILEDYMKAVGVE